MTFTAARDAVIFVAAAVVTTETGYLIVINVATAEIATHHCFATAAVTTETAALVVAPLETAALGLAPFETAALGLAPLETAALVVAPHEIAVAVTNTLITTAIATHHCC